MTVPTSTEPQGAHTMIPPLSSADGPPGFSVPETMTTHELGDTMARLIWESFSDYIGDGEAAALLGSVGMDIGEGIPDERVAEELLIFFMWAHTRGIQLAFVQRVAEGTLKGALDAMHGAVFEDMVAQGTPKSQLPVFEQRVSARYAEYHEAARASDSQVGRVALRHVTGMEDVPDALALRLAERAVAVAGPLRDFLEEVDLQDS